MLLKRNQLYIFFNSRGKHVGILGKQLWKRREHYDMKEYEEKEEKEEEK